MASVAAYAGSITYGYATNPSAVDIDTGGPFSLYASITLNSPLPANCAFGDPTCSDVTGNITAWSVGDPVLSKNSSVPFLELPIYLQSITFLVGTSGGKIVDWFLSLGGYAKSGDERPFTHEAFIWNSVNNPCDDDDSRCFLEQIVYQKSYHYLNNRGVEQDDILEYYGPTSAAAFKGVPNPGTWTVLTSGTASVPEPGTAAMAALSTVGFLLCNRKKLKSSAN